ncbi:SIR2 family protein [Modestobacter caceresii]|uniref:SIR2 family protein n=1 Tax=Modestobacter caceresii TaxID=1522368 RepID=UPI0009DD1DB0|nr:SIR2 family protein [Modestobacter caceresii]
MPDGNAEPLPGLRLGKEILRGGPPFEPLTPTEQRKIESWFAALLQIEHVTLLVGNGLSMAVGAVLNAWPPTMKQSLDAGEATQSIKAHAARSAKIAGRDPNLEDEIRSALSLIQGYEVLGEEAKAHEVQDAVDAAMTKFIGQVLTFERAVRDGHRAQSPEAREVANLLQRFLLPFSARAAGRDRLNLFTTNYDRLLEFAADLLGVRLIDRFVGTLEPTFSASRLDLDMHYSPPGIRGEPRLLEGVVRYGKVHGSVDWRTANRLITKAPLGFGADSADPSFPTKPSETAVIYPNPAKDVETLAYPYAELFRDLAASICRPNAVLFTYGYGFGDSHINRVITDMLTIPSTHLVVISRDPLSGLETFKQGYYPPDQTTELIGPDVGALDKIVGFIPSIASLEFLEAQALYAERGSRIRQATADYGTDSAAATGATVLPPPVLP